MLTLALQLAARTIGARLAGHVALQALVARRAEAGAGEWVAGCPVEAGAGALAVGTPQVRVTSCGGEAGMLMRTAHTLYGTSLQQGKLRHREREPRSPGCWTCNGFCSESSCLHPFSELGVGCRSPSAHPGWAQSLVLTAGAVGTPPARLTLALVRCHAPPVDAL